MHNPVKIILDGVLRADGPSEFIQQLGTDHRCRNRQLFKRQGGSRTRVHIKINGIDHERPKGGLVLVVECHSFDSPAPPLHVLDVGHPVVLLRSQGWGSPKPGWRDRWWRSRRVRSPLW